MSNCGFNSGEICNWNYDYEEQVRGIYRGSVPTSGLTQGTTYDRDTYNYAQDSCLYNIPETDSQTNGQSLKLYEERLVASKQRKKTGEVSVGKRIETETTHVAVPIEKEKVVIERNSTNFSKSK